MHNRETGSNTYRVQVGYTVVHVRGSSVQEAIAHARRKLAQEMPRFYDVICDLEPTKFEVQRAV